MRETIPTPRRDPPLSRAIDMALATLLLLPAAPLLLVVAVLLRANGGPVLFRQQRLGRGGVPFTLHKFCTLSTTAGEPVAPSGDPRITRVGRGLRRWRLDELPQLFDVLRGRMALVGPRPEVPANLVAVPPEHLAGVLAVRPGLTGPTQLRFFAEDDVLATVPDPVRSYREILMPAKAREDLAWLDRRTQLGDLAVLLRTPFVLASRRARLRSEARVRALLDAGTGRLPGTTTL